MFDAANDPIYDEKAALADAQRRQEYITTTTKDTQPPYYVFRMGTVYSMWGYITRYGYMVLDYPSFESAEAAAQDYARRAGYDTGR